MKIVKLIALATVFSLGIISVHAQTFVDTEPSSWEYPYVEDMVSKSIVDKNYYFHPSTPITRAELVKMMVVASSGVIDDSLPKKPTFPDVSPSEWYYPYIETAKLNKIIDGYPDGLFRPGQEVTRAEAIKIIINGLGISKSNTPPARFNDYNHSEWFQIYVTTAFNKGIIGWQTNEAGMRLNSFRPGDSTTRAEISKMISLSLKASTLH